MRKLHGNPFQARVASDGELTFPPFVEPSQHNEPPITGPSQASEPHEDPLTREPEPEVVPMRSTKEPFTSPATPASEIIIDDMPIGSPPPFNPMMRLGSNLQTCDQPS
ncbi:hypothetical protein O181_010956 [Austropuccinia psidii MF-1]|uniref:Uncharacterized protein n=1 Tax=Austropuccinia psidii MF-1 TaxID=1389203 RepID=A0A9Q3BS09_9BASI|nr:hypothetical protein [Austropuccinia psidii MF-1]